MASAPPHVIYLPESSNISSTSQQKTGYIKEYQSSGGLTTGVIQVICAILSVITGGVAYIGFRIATDGGVGIWAGLVVYLPAGILGIVSKSKNSCVIIAYMIMSIIACVAGLCLLVAEVQLSLGTQCNDSSCSIQNIVLQSLIGIISFVEVITSLAGWIYCTAVLCCRSPGTRERYSGKYNSTAGYATGIVQLICAILAVIIGGVSYIVLKITIDGGVGVWSGLILFLPAGILGIVSKKKSPCVIIAYLIVCSLASLESFCLLAVEVQFAAGFTNSCIGVDCDSMANTVVQSLIAIVALVEFVASLTALIYCLGAVCCNVMTTVQHPRSAQVVMQQGPASAQVVMQQDLYH